MVIKAFSRIRFHFKRRNTEPYLFWYRILGFSPKDVSPYNEAMTHKSAQVYDVHKQLVSNERLEFLGDAILASVIAEYLYEKYPDKNEGFLTNVRSRIVCRENMNHIARQLGLDTCLKRRNIADHVENVYGNALEALLGAIYVDRGYGYCKRFIEHKMLQVQYVDLEKIVRKDTNSKSRLLEWAQKRKKTLVFEFADERVVDESGRKMFFYNVVLDGKVITRSSGMSKQQAQQNAAKTALNKLNVKSRG